MRFAVSTISLDARRETHSIVSQEIRLYGSGLESATKAAKTIVLFLTRRSGKGKATKNSNEAEYRTIFDNLITDLLAVLYWPEWPAASLLLSIACKFMVSLHLHSSTSSSPSSFHLFSFFVNLLTELSHRCQVWTM